MTKKQTAFGLAGVVTGLFFCLWALLSLLPPPALLQGIDSARLVLDRDGRLLRMGLSKDDKYRIHIPLQAVASQAIEALLLYEDKYFYAHPGVNPLAMTRAAWTWLTGGRRSGASTLTMQVARLRYGLPTGTWWGKVRQIWLALRLERHYSKEEILQAYFNLAPYGANIEGIEAAARIYFHKPASRLTTSEVLALTVVPQHPARRNPRTGAGFAQARRLLAELWCQTHQDAAATATSAFQDQLAEDKAPHESAAPAADADKGSVNAVAALTQPLQVYSTADLPFAAPHLSAQLLANRHENRLRSSVSLVLQETMERQIRLFTARGKAYGLSNAAAILVHAPTGEVLGLVGSADFFNTDIDGQVDGTLARRSPGSTLKPFIYALALDQGLIHPQSLLIDSPRSFSGYDPENFDKGFRGPVPAETALRASRNLPALILAQKLSAPDLYAFLERSKVRLPRGREYYGLSLVLGGAELSMRELASLYAILVNQGYYRPLRLVRPWAENPAPVARHSGRPSVTAEDQEYAPADQNTAEAGPPLRLLSREAAFITLDMLKRTDTRVNSSGQATCLHWKTGTSNGFRDAWTAGTLGPYVLVVWVGNFDNSPNPLLVGGLTAQPLFEDMARALAPQLTLPPEEMPADLNVTRIAVCAGTGDTDTSLCPQTTETWFIPGVSPVRNSGVYRKVLIDTATGLRDCRPQAGKNSFEVRQFWPDNLRAIFAQAGLHKPAPPAWLPQCRPTDPDMAGRGPEILSPKAGVIYHVQLSARQRNSVPLTAGSTEGATQLFWFVNGRFLGAAAAGTTLLWQAEAGVHELLCMDDLGRSSVRRLEVRAAL